MNMELGKAAGCLLLLCVCLGGQAESQELKIERKERVVSYLQDGDQILKRWIKVGDDLYKARFIVPSHYSNQAADPFGDESDATIDQNPKKYLEEIGVTFGKGAKASYDKTKSILTVVQNDAQMSLVEAYFSTGCCLDPKQIRIRAEIYELPSRLALELLESCEGQSDNSPERNAVNQLVKEGGAKLIGLPSVISRSGQRSKVTGTYEVPFLEQAENESKEGEEKPRREAVIGTRLVGTILEIDPVLGADNWTIDLSLNLEHHTAPPEFFPVAKEVEIPIFHSKEITTQISLLKGSYVLVGTWKPTGKAEYEEKDLTHLVFLTANVQYLNDYGLLQAVEDSGDKKKSPKK